ncbi:MAG: BspA family leucine-rich repeat surface protein, partial [Defluviitaleaceae bacterium]|nr:BspA family leucine-rich repeat surface protein [Defluviitaleaceae bacterium]
NVTSMERMFRNASQLSTLDISGWDMTSVDNTFQMLSGVTSLRVLSLGANFRANVLGSTALPAVPSSAAYTGMWQNVGAGTIYDPQGEYVLTSVELMGRYAYGGSAADDTWVWQGRD